MQSPKLNEPSLNHHHHYTAPLDSRAEGATGSGAGYGDQLVYPKGLSETERVAAGRQLEPFPLELAQQLLDELAGRMAVNAIHLTPLAYLRGLVGERGPETETSPPRWPCKLVHNANGSARPTPV
jgi:hypothetical protein